MFTAVLIKNKVLLEKSHTYLLLLQVVTYFQEFSVTTAAAAAVYQVVLQREKSSPSIPGFIAGHKTLYCCSVVLPFQARVPTHLVPSDMIKHTARIVNKVLNPKSTQHITFTSAQTFGREKWVLLLCLFYDFIIRLSVGICANALQRSVKSRGLCSFAFFFICAHVILCSIAVELRHRGPEFLADDKLDACRPRSPPL